MLKNSLVFNFAHKLFLFLLLFSFIVFPLVLELLYFKFFLIIINLFFSLLLSIHLNNGSKLISILLSPRFLIFLLYSFFSIIYSFFYGYPGTVKMLQEYILWPIVYVIIFSVLNHNDYFNFFIKAIFYSFIFVIIYSFLLLFQFYFTIKLPFIPYFPTFPQDVFIKNGFFEMSFPGMNSMTFGIGYLSSLNKSWFKNIFVHTLILLFILITGRRIFILLYLISLILNYFHNFKKSNFQSIVIPIIFFLISLVLFYDIYNVAFEIVSNAIFEDENNVRILQIFYLLEGWLENARTFLFGSGLGSFTPNIIRSPTMPWSYEVFFVASLFHYGLIGFIIFLNFILAPTIKLFYFKTPILKPLSIGVFTLLFASFTNPYLMRYDGVWMIIIPFILYKATKVYNCKYVKF